MASQPVEISFNLSTKLNKDGEEKKSYTSMPDNWQLLTNSLINPSHNGRGRLTGKINNLTVFDFDDMISYGKFLDDHPTFREADYFGAISKKGIHLYFQYDADCKTGTNVMEKYSGVDIRNDNAFITIPPTKYKLLDGSVFEYEWMDDTGGKILPVPLELKQYLKTEIAKSKKTLKCETKPKVVTNNDYQLISKLLPILEPLSVNYQDWINVTMCLKHSGENFKDLFHEFSKMCSEKYDEDECNKTWDNIKEKNNGLSIGSLIFYAKNINPELTSEIMGQFKESNYNYKLLKQEWEEKRKLAFIHSTSEYCYEDHNGILLFKRKDDIKNSLSNVFYKTMEKGIEVEKLFFDTWNKDKERKEYDDVGVISPDMKENDKILNLWKPFYCQTLKFDTTCDIQVILDYLMVMAGHSKEVYDYFLKYIRNMLLYPSKPQQMICLANVEQGNGKSTLFKLLEKMIGRDRCFEAKTITTDVCGTFNGHLEYKILTHLEDIQPEDYRKNEAEMRSIINKDYVPIHHKGKKIVERKNFNHFILTTNYLHTVRYTDEQRRVMGVECGIDYLNNIKKFEELYNLIENDHFIYSFYKYLCDEIECPKILNKSDLPMTKLMKEGCDMNVDNIVSFVRELENKEYQTIVLYDMFKKFSRQRGYDDKRTYNTFAIDIYRDWETDRKSTRLNSSH